MSDVWSVVLSRYNETSIKLQSSTCDLKLDADLLESRDAFTDDLRNRFDEFEDRAKQLSGTIDYMSVVARLCYSAAGVLMKNQEQR